ncbi:MAG: type IV pilus secretin PilQ [Flexistipes sinusarabici]|uniref:Type IV pilus secretin PilQ n=1 Tax=Flexistipes sinusarabici TaxID=2352 RepID=A0A5D0MRB5_FLESI|nr:type IV pilus secretin PilQ [Flexistipes sinusarabici]TYB34363.1 MAG: type IV pilus secretin PilQ [Flexistipes sinusarabici]
MKSTISRTINLSITCENSRRDVLHIPYALNLIFVFTVLVLLVSCAQKPVKTVEEDTQKITVTDISVDKNNNNYEMNITTDGEALFNTYYSKTPYKIIAMVENADFSAELMEYNYSAGIVESVNLIPSANFATIEVKLREDVSYSFSQSAQELTVNFKPVSETKVIGKSGMDTENISVSEHKVAKHVESYSNLSSGSDLLVNIGLDGIVRYDYGYLDDGRFYLDLFDVKSELSRKAYPGKGPVESVKVGSYYPPQKVRFIFEITESMPMFVGQNGNKLVVSNNISQVPEEAKYIVSMDNIFVNNYQSIVVKLTNNVPFTKKVIDGNLVLTFDAPLKVLNSVKNVLSFNDQPFKKAKVVEINGKTSLIVEPNGDIYAKVDKMPEGILITGSFNEFSKADITMKEQVKPIESAEKSKKNTKKEDLISINIKKMDVKEAIRLVYYGRAENLVFGKNVQGTVTLYLDKVDYRNALNMIYKENGLMEVKENNITWVVTKERYQQMQQAKLQAKQQEKEQKKFEPIYTEIVPVNYSNASEYKGIISSVLSERGNLQIEKRTNSFIISDTDSGIKRAKELLAKLDKPIPQVEIEARIVEVFDTNNMNIGIQWGGNYNQSATTANFPNTINVEGNTAAMGPSGSGYLVNLPVGNPAGALALSVGNVANTFNLDVALSALETQNKVKTISSPRITTLNNQEAEIKSGSTAIIVPTGDNTEAEEVDVGIKLNITPQITPNNMIFLNIEVEKSTLGQVTANTATTEEKKASTQVLLENGETTVIGGIYENSETNTIQGVPFFQNIPFLGWMFKSKQNIVDKKELMVFITPRVVE